MTLLYKHYQVGYTVCHPEAKPRSASHLKFGCQILVPWPRQSYHPTWQGLKFGVGYVMLCGIILDEEMKSGTF